MIMQTVQTLHALTRTPSTGLPSNYQYEDGVCVITLEAAADLGWSAGEYPELLAYDNHIWERDTPQFNVQGKIDVTYRDATDPDYPAWVRVRANV